MESVKRIIVASVQAVLLVWIAPVAATGQASPRSAAAVLDQFSSGRLEPAAAESRAACERPDARADSIQTGLLALPSLTAEQEAMLIAAWSDFAGACRNAAVTAWLVERLERPTDPMQRLVVVGGMGVTERGRETVLRVIAQMDMTELEMESLTDLAFSTVRPGTAVAELAAGYERHGVIASGVLALRLAGARVQGIDVTEANAVCYEPSRIDPAWRVRIGFSWRWIMMRDSMHRALRSGEPISSGRRAGLPSWTDR